jgi:two-component system phosphate regulon response regulator PhoB
MSTMKILLVDDSKFLRKAVSSLLQARGYKVFEAGDGETALTIALQEHPNAILLDMILPKLSGTDVLRRLKQDASTATTPVIMLTGIGKETELRTALAAGADRCLLKDNLQLTELVLALEQVASVSATLA